MSPAPSRVNPLPMNHVERLILCLLVSVFLACGPGDVGGSGTGSGTTSGAATASDGADNESGIVPDPVECTVPTCTNMTGQYDPAGCCEGLQPSAETDDSTCPSDVYPNNWTCDGSGNCVHGGCTSDSDCPASMTCLDPEEDSDDIGFCVKTCEETLEVPDPCNYAYTGTMCTGIGSDSQDVSHAYCRQHPFPP